MVNVDVDDRMRPAVDEIGVIGFGAFGRLMAKHLGAHFRLCVYDPTIAPSGANEAADVAFVSQAVAASRPIVILATPVDRLAAAIASAAPHLRPGALVLDVASVKTGPAAIMAQWLPGYVDIIGSHPLFGPQSARDGLAGLKIALCPIRGDRTPCVAAFLERELGLQVFVTTPEAHDRDAAMVQGLTHLIAKVIVRMEPLPAGMTTASFDKLVQAVAMVRDDAPEVFMAIVRDNPYAAEVRERFFALADEVRASLG